MCLQNLRKTELASSINMPMYLGFYDGRVNIIVK